MHCRRGHALCVDGQHAGHQAGSIAVALERVFVRDQRQRNLLGGSGFCADGAPDLAAAEGKAFRKRLRGGNAGGQQIGNRNILGGGAVVDDVKRKRKGFARTDAAVIASVKGGCDADAGHAQRDRHSGAIEAGAHAHFAQQRHLLAFAAARNERDFAGEYRGGCRKLAAGRIGLRAFKRRLPRGFLRAGEALGQRKREGDVDRLRIGVVCGQGQRERSALFKARFAGVERERQIDVGYGEGFGAHFKAFA